MLPLLQQFSYISESLGLRNYGWENYNTCNADKKNKEVGIRSPEIRGGFELPCRCWESNPSPLPGKLLLKHAFLLPPSLPRSVSLSPRSLPHKNQPVHRKAVQVRGGLSRRKSTCVPSTPASQEKNHWTGNHVLYFGNYLLTKIVTTWL